jgi:hypoxanthine phosphoribosyltransferase
MNENPKYVYKEIEQILFTHEQIAEQVKRVGAEITRDYQGKKPLFIGILKGSFVFMADLVRAVDLPCRIDFLSAKSYGEGTVSSGFVRIVKDIDEVVEGRDVIVVEDILDTANTLSSVCEVLQARKPASLKICTFLEKDVSRKIALVPDYYCFRVENEFVVGYGLDYAEKYRNLPYLGMIKK